MIQKVASLGLHCKHIGHEKVREKGVQQEPDVYFFID